MSEVTWLKDELQPRVDLLLADFSPDDVTLPVAHPEWFRAGDIVRVGDDDLYDTGELDEWGQPIFRARNEAVRVLSGVVVERAIGVNPAQAKAAGERVVILAGAPVADR